MEPSNGCQFTFEAEQLMQAVNIALSATANVQERSQAYILCEKFKEESPLCATVGFELALAGRNPAAKHFGLQLIEHCIKFRWNNLQPQEKVSIKVYETITTRILKANLNFYTLLFHSELSVGYNTKRIL